MRHLQWVTLLLVISFTTTSAWADKIKVGYNQWAGFAPVFVAAEKGFFKDAGVEVELVPFPGPGDSLAPLLAGHLDASLTTPDNVIALNAAGSRIACVYVIDTSDGADAVVAKSMVGDPAALKGKTIATTIGEVNYLLLLKALEAGKLGENDVKLVNMNPDDAGTAFLAGSVDAAVTWEPWVSKAVSEGGGHVIFSSRDAPNLLMDVVAVSEKTLSEKPAAIKALIAGINAGLSFLKSNPDQALLLAGKWLDVDGPKVEAMLDGVRLYTMNDNAELFTKRTPLVEPLTTISTFLYEQGKIKAKPDVEAMIVGNLVLDR
jgi:NitT/TauT family transport system substrate-binding protein